MRRMLVYAALLVALALAWLILVQPVKASGCYPSYRYSSYYSYPRYSSYYSPPVYYDYTPVKVVKEVVREKEYVPVATYVPVPFPLYTLTSQGGVNYQAAGAQNGAAYQAQAAGVSAAHAAAPNACAEANAKVARLEAQMELLLRIMGSGGIGARAATPGGSASPPPGGPPPAPVKPPAKEPPSADLIQSGVNALYTQCSKCHDKAVAATDGGKFVLFDGERMSDLTERQWAKMELEVRDDGMPPKVDKKGSAVPRPPAEAKRQILAFLAERKRAAKPAAE